MAQMVRERFEAANRIDPIDPVRASVLVGRHPRRGKYQRVPPNRRFAPLAAVPRISQLPSSGSRNASSRDWPGLGSSTRFGEQWDGGFDTACLCNGDLEGDGGIREGLKTRREIT